MTGRENIDAFRPLLTERLNLRPPRDTQHFQAFADAEWARWSIGPLLVESRASRELLGTSGLSFETPCRASTGYVLAQQAWGQGYATEALRACAELAGRLGVRQLYALCHVDHLASARVLEKAGFSRDAVLNNFMVFPNLERTDLQDVCRYYR